MFRSLCSLRSISSGFREFSPLSTLPCRNPLKSYRSMMSQPDSPKILSIPSSVRGMTSLDEEEFKKSVKFPILCVNGSDLSKIRGKVRLEKYLVKNLVTIKNVMNSEEKTKKLLVFDPDAVKEGDSELRGKIIEQIQEVTESTPEWEEKEMDVDFSNWDAKSVIRAILPNGLDFSSFTQTGHIVHCNFRDEMEPYKGILGEILLKKVKQCRTVVNKLDGIKTEYRNFEIELVAGEPDYVSTVTERGITYKMDFSKVFWNSRLQHEHERVLRLIDHNSLVYDACAGIGPFVLPAAKQKAARVVLANDLNPESVKWLLYNKKQNKIKEDQAVTSNLDAVVFIRGPAADSLAQVVKAMKSDAEYVAPSGAHFIANLPAYSVNFIPAFRGMLCGKLSATDLPSPAPFNVTFYCYLFVKAKEDVEEQWYVDRAHEMVQEQLQWPAAKVNLAHHVRTVSSRKEMFCMQVDMPWDFLTTDSAAASDEPEAKKQKLEASDD